MIRIRVRRFPDRTRRWLPHEVQTHTEGKWEKLDFVPDTTLMFYTAIAILFELDFDEMCDKGLLYCHGSDGIWNFWELKENNRMKDQPGATIRGLYYIVHDIPLFMKRKRIIQYVQLAPNTLKGMSCHCCKKTFDGTESNLTDLVPVRNGKSHVKAMHYVCAWGGTLEQIDKLADHVLVE